MKELPETYKRLFGLIPRGSDEPIPITDLARVLNTDTRQVNMMIHNLVVRYGIPVCSYRDPYRNGVFIPITEEERTDGLLTQKEQVKSQSDKIRVIETADLNIIHKYEELYPETKRIAFLIPYVQTELEL